MPQQPDREQQVVAEQMEESRKAAAAIKPGAASFDVIVVGSGAAGGMAAFQLATAGVKVLLLEAGRMLDPTREYRTMEWPYASLRRGRLPADEYALGAAEYNMIDRPYGTAGRFEKYRKLLSNSGNTFNHNWMVDEKQNPTTGTQYAWVRARVLGGKTNLWGRVALRMSDYDFKAASRDGFGDDWPISYADLSPYYDQVDTLLGISGTRENLPQLPRQHLSARSQAQLRRADHTTPGFGSAFKQNVRADYPAPINFTAFGEVLARRENQVELDPAVRDGWGIPVLKFNYRFGDNEIQMAKDMAETSEEMLKAAGAEDVRVRRDILTEGWSIHELGTARMGKDPKTSVTNSFGQTHDVKNLFVVDGSIFVSASCQNPTWTILALCWRAMDYLKEELRTGNIA